jgi:hypothetical protein
LAIPDSALSSGAALKAAEPGKETAEELSDDPKLEAEGGCEKIAGKVHGKICQFRYLLVVMQSPSVGMNNQKGGSNVVDHCCGTGNSVDAGTGERLYDR